MPHIIPQPGTGGEEGKNGAKRFAKEFCGRERTGTTDILSVAAVPPGTHWGNGHPVRCCRSPLSTLRQRTSCPLLQSASGACFRETPVGRCERPVSLMSNSDGSQNGLRYRCGLRCARPRTRRQDESPVGDWRRRFHGRLRGFASAAAKSPSPPFGFVVARSAASSFPVQRHGSRFQDG